MRLRRNGCTLPAAELGRLPTTSRYDAVISGGRPTNVEGDDGKAMMPVPERFDVQLQRARRRRAAYQYAAPATLAIAGYVPWMLWAGRGWPWWCIGIAIPIIGVGAWLSRCYADGLGLATRRFWRPPR